MKGLSGNDNPAQLMSPQRRCQGGRENETKNQPSIILQISILFDVISLMVRQELIH